MLYLKLPSSGLAILGEIKLPAGKPNHLDQLLRTGDPTVMICF